MQICYHCQMSPSSCTWTTFDSRTPVSFRGGTGTTIKTGRESKKLKSGAGHIVTKGVGSRGSIAFNLLRPTFVPGTATSGRGAKKISSICYTSRRRRQRTRFKSSLQTLISMTFCMGGSATQRCAIDSQGQRAPRGPSGPLYQFHGTVVCPFLCTILRTGSCPLLSVFIRLVVLSLVYL